jgi:hypothetical protein
MWSCIEGRKNRLPIDCHLAEAVGRRQLSRCALRSLWSSHVAVSNAAAGTGAYYVKVTASQDFFMDAHNQYIVAVWLE